MLAVALVRVRSGGGSFSKVVGVSERVGDAVGDGDDRSTEGDCREDGGDKGVESSRSHNR